MADDPEETEDEDGIDDPEDSDDSEEEEEAADDSDDSDESEASEEDSDEEDEAEASEEDSDEEDEAEASEEDSDEEAEASDDDSDQDDDEASNDDSDEEDDPEALDDDGDEGDGDEGDGAEASNDDDAADGDNHDLVIPYEDVEIEFEWPPYIADRLPDDFTLTLSADEMDDQTVTASGAEWTEEGAVRFAFGWRKKTRAVTLKATSGDQTITLWDDQVVGDLSTMVDWASWLDPLLAPEEDVQAYDDGPTGASSTPPDLNWDETLALLDDELE